MINEGMIMATNYRPSEEISFNKLRKEVEDIGLSIEDNDETTKDNFCITDGESYLWCNRVGKDDVEFCKFGANYVTDILEQIGAHFSIDIISEHDEEFWGDEDFEQIEE